MRESRPISSKAITAGGEIDGDQGINRVYTTATILKSMFPWISATLLQLM